MMLPPSHHGFDTASKQCRSAVSGSADSAARCVAAYASRLWYDSPCGEKRTERVRLCGAGGSDETERTERIDRRLGVGGGVGGARRRAVAAREADAMSAACRVIEACDSGVAGGVRIDLVNILLIGGLYVIPMAAWRPVTSLFWRMNATVTSPGSSPA